MVKKDAIGEIAPTWIEESEKNYNSQTEYFPMALSGATELTRAVYDKHSEFLPNPNNADYGQYRGEGQKLLDAVSKLAIQWYLNCVKKDFLLDKIILAVRCFDKINNFLASGYPAQTRTAAVKSKTIKENLEALILKDKEATLCPPMLIAQLDKVIANPPSAKRKEPTGDKFLEADTNLKIYIGLLATCQNNILNFIKKSNMKLKIEMIKFIKTLSDKFSEWYKIDVPASLIIKNPFPEEKEKKKEKEEKKEEEGAGFADRGDSSPWFKYTQTAMNKILKLRLDSVQQEKSATIVNTVTFDGTYISAEDILIRLIMKSG